MSACRTCGVELRFIRTEASIGKRPKYMPVRDDAQLVEVSTDDRKIIRGYVPHFAECEKAGPGTSDFATIITEHGAVVRGTIR